MNKIERNEAVKNGLTVLRSQWNQRKQCWNIVQYSKTNGWIATGFKSHLNKEDCENAIDVLVSFSKQYLKD